MLLFIPKWTQSDLWKATLTPLASIIGSGFLILGPLLQNEFGTYAVWGMVFLCVAAYLIGTVVRFNIAYVEPELNSDACPRGLQLTEKLADISLVLAYVVSITYYLNLFGAFFIKAFGYENSFEQKVVSTTVISFIGIFGLLKGLDFLEKLEKVSVSIKLAIIGGLLFGLMVFNGKAIVAHEWELNEPHVSFSWNSFAVLVGLIITVQGFETSRFLGEKYDQQTRIKSMKRAQWISSVIYLLYIGLSLINYVGPTEGGSSETAIIDQSLVIATILPALLIVAALAAQFSAAVADTNGGSGLAVEVTNGVVKSKWGVFIICALGVGLTWLFDIFEIISLASKAFAVFYGIQCLSAIQLAISKQLWFKSALFALVFVMCMLVIFVGVPAE
ncbi:hypothetical protein N7E81_12285 [Reichenbachiella carrageenanivorans]|uniref:Mn2+ and Fe2+ transporters of the NRAMP family n=1 Tax=Reichenbachiella carrageenanivorans TaxID=2979869 RepID=A0ABY6CW47_9BACT|nr:hypothetical protein [Reichenbachiella carrageenanivorans]UXX78137.1 hypothetical protein N7E81_12285 [Reichenbachiella carrageenanivorans]